MSYVTIFSVLSVLGLTGCTLGSKTDSTSQQTLVSQCSELKKSINYKINVVAWSLESIQTKIRNATRSYSRAGDLSTRISYGFSDMKRDSSLISSYASYANDLSSYLGESVRETNYLKSDIQKIVFPFADGSIEKGIAACQGEEFSHDLYARRNQNATCKPFISSAEYEAYWLNVAFANARPYSEYTTQALNNARWKENENDRNYELRNAEKYLSDTFANSYEIERHTQKLNQALSQIQTHCL